MLRGTSRASKLSANSLTDLIEERSSFRTLTRAVLLSLRILCFASFAASMFLAAIMTWAFLSANILAVSRPIPLAPPAASSLWNIWESYERICTWIVGRRAIPMEKIWTCENPTDWQENLTAHTPTSVNFQTFGPVESRNEQMKKKVHKYRDIYFACKMGEPFPVSEKWSVQENGSKRPPSFLPSSLFGPQCPLISKF